MNTQKLENKISEIISFMSHCKVENCDGCKYFREKVMHEINEHVKKEKHESWLEGKEDTIRLMKSGIELSKAIKSHKLQTQHDSKE